MRQISAIKIQLDEILQRWGRFPKKLRVHKRAKITLAITTHKVTAYTLSIFPLVQTGIDFRGGSL